MRRPWRLAATLAAAALIALAGACGVPSSSAPVIDGSVTGRGGGGGGAPHLLPGGPSTSTTARDLVDAYLNAIAGQTDPESTPAREAVTAFMTDNASQHWSPTGKVTVVRPTTGYHQQIEGNRTKIDATFQIVGAFSPVEGTLEPPTVGTPSSVKLTFFVTGPATGLPDDGKSGLTTSGLRIDQAPQGSYMSEEALHEFYQARSIYFWDSAGEGLIPELRYVPLTVSRVQRETIVVNWVLAGPSDALIGATSRVVNTTLLDPQVQEDGDKVVVDVATAHNFGPDDRRRLAHQLRWSLLGLGPQTDTVDPPPVDIYVDRQQQLLDDQPTFLSANVVSSRPEAVGFAIGKGVARPLEGPQIPLLSSSTNTNVKLAAVTHDETNAALVRSASSGGVELWIRRGTDKSHDFVKVMRANSMTRPVWLATPQNYLAIVADGKLYFFDSRNHRTLIQLGGIGAIKAMSVAPEGRRFALITNGGGLYVSVVAWQNKVPTMLSPRHLQVQLSSPTAVAWSKTDQLAVAGRDGDDNKLFEVNSDGSEMTSLSEAFAGSAITQVVAYPYDGLDRSRSGPIMFETSNGSRQVKPAEGTVPLTWGPGAPSDIGSPVSPFFFD